MRIGISFDLAPVDPALRSEGPDDRYEEFDKPETVEAIAGLVRRLGGEVQSALKSAGREGRSTTPPPHDADASHTTSPAPERTDDADPTADRRPGDVTN